MSLRGIDVQDNQDAFQDALLPVLTPTQQAEVMELCGEIDGVLADGPNRSTMVIRGTELEINGVTVAINQEVPISNPAEQLSLYAGQTGTNYWFSEQVYSTEVDVRTWVGSSKLARPVNLPSNTGGNREDFFDPFTHTIVNSNDTRYWAKLDAVTDGIKKLLDQDSQVTLYDSWTLPEQDDTAAESVAQDTIVELNKAYLWKEGSVTDPKAPLIGRSVLFWVGEQEGTQESTRGELLYLQQRHPWAEIYFNENLAVSPYIFINAGLVRGLTRLVRDIRLAANPEAPNS